MNPPSDNPAPTPASLAAELEQVKRREAWHRAKTVQDFLVRETQLRAQAAKIDELNESLSERNTYVHRLHEERAGFVRAEQAIFADLEAFTERLRAAEDEAEALRAALSEVKRSWGWKLCEPLRRLQRRFAPLPPPPPAGPDPAAPVPGGIFTYYLHTSPFRLYRSDSFRLRGWAWPADGRAVTAVRVRIDRSEFIGRHGLEEPEVIARQGAQPANPRPGFEVDFTIPPGRHRLSLEAQIEHAEWRSILVTPVWRQAPAP